MVRWLEAGIAVFRVHSFEARNVTSIVEDQMAVTHAMLLTDAYRALEMLGSHPGIEAARIGTPPVGYTWCRLSASSSSAYKTDFLRRSYST